MTGPTRYPAAQVAEVTEQLVQMKQLSMPQLWALWDEFFERRPGHHHRTYLENRIAYKIQERAFGALPDEVRRTLERIGETGVIPKSMQRAAIALTPGTVLLREFGDRKHRVEVLTDGRFNYEGRPFGSLSAVARAITGSAWNGRVFFGLKAPAKAKARAEGGAQ